MTTDAELVRMWREGLQETARRCRQWPAEVRHDAAMESFLPFLEAARRGEQVHKAAPHWVGRKAFRYLTHQRRSGRGFHGRPIASAAMLGPELGERVAPDEWIAAQPVHVDLDAVLDEGPRLADLRRDVAARVERARKLGESKRFAAALLRLAETHGEARKVAAERCGVRIRTMHAWLAGRVAVPVERREHLIWAAGLGPCPGPPPPRKRKGVPRPPLVDPTTVPHSPPPAPDAALALALLLAHQPTTIASACGVGHKTARQWRTGERKLPDLRAQQILSAHRRGDLPLPGGRP